LSSNDANYQCTQRNITKNDDIATFYLISVVYKEAIKLCSFSAVAFYVCMSMH